MPDSSNILAHNWFPGISNDTFFSTIITISIFILGYFLNRLYDWWKEKTRLRDIREFILAILDNVLPAIEKQINAFDSVYQQITSREHQDYILGESTSLTFDALDSLPRSDVFYAFTRIRRRKRKDRTKHFNSLWDSIDFIRHQRELVREAFIRFNQSYMKYLRSWNENVDSILRLHDEYLMMAMRDETSPSEDPFFKEFNFMVHRLSNQPESKRWDHLKKNFIDPLLEHCKGHPADFRSVLVTKKIIQSQDAYDNREHLFESYQMYFDQQATSLREKKQSLESSLAFFSG